MNRSASSSASSSGAYAAVLAVAAALAGCDSQAGPEYRGEPLVRLDGTASSEGPIAEGVSAKLQWVQFLAEPIVLDADVFRPAIDVSPGSPLRPQGDTPTHLVLEVFDRPGPWLNDFSRGGADPRESRIAMSEIQEDGDGLREPSGALWYAYSRQVLVYVEKDVRPGTVSETFVGAPLHAGFHVLDVVDAPCDSYLPADDPMEGELDCLRPAREDLHTRLDLRFVRYMEDPGLTEEEEATLHDAFFAQFPRLYDRAVQGSPGEP